MALLAPITILIFSFLIFRYSSYFSLSDKPEWKTAIIPPNLSVNLLTVWGVKLIYGIKTIAVLLLLITFSINSIYTSVFPDPVTPYNK